MTVRVVIVVIMVIYFVAVTVCSILYARKSLVKANQGRTYFVQCNKCGTQQQVSYEVLTRHLMQKSISVSAEARVGQVGAGGTHYNKISKKVYCPSCGKETWNQLLGSADESGVMNTNAAMMRNTTSMLPAVGLYFGLLIMGLLVFRGIASILSIF